MDHGDLVSLFQEFREFIRPEVVDGVPDFTAAAMKKQYSGLQQLQKRLAAFDIRNWSVAHQVDYHVVRAEMNGVEFDHRVLRQWARDPGFYNFTDGIYPGLLVHHSRSLSNWGLYKPEVPLPENKVADFRIKLETVPKLFAQAKINLTEAAGDLATVAIRVKEKDVEMLTRFRVQFAEYHPGLVSTVDRAVTATEDFRDWLIANKDTMTAPAGVGKENYN